MIDSDSNKTPDATKRSAFLRNIFILVGIVFFIVVATFFATRNVTNDHEKVAIHASHNSASAHGGAQISHVVGASPVPEMSDALCKDLTSSSNPAQSQQYLQAQQIKAKDEIKALFQQAINSPDLHLRAAALFMHAEFQAKIEMDEFSKKYPNCNNDANCGQQMRQQASNAHTKDVNEIAKLAHDSNDPLLYATAFYACNAWNKVTDGTDSFCQQISAVQWAQRDSDNGIAWMYVAQQAAKENRIADLDQAMFRLSQLKALNERRVGLLQLRDNFELPKKNAFVQLELANLNNSTYKQWSFPDYKQIENYCNVDQLADSNRRQVCDRIADKLFADKSLLIHNEIGAQIGERLGWQAQKLASFKLDDAAFKGLQMLEHPPGIYDETEKGTPSEKMLNSCQDSFREARSIINIMQYGQIHGIQKRFGGQARSKQELASYFQALMIQNQAPEVQRKLPLTMAGGK